MSLESIPTWFSDTMVISLEAAQAILSMSVFLAVLLPVLYFNRGRKGFTIELIMIFLIESVLVGIGWLPFWLLVMTIGAVALAIAFVGSGAVTGD